MNNDLEQFTEERLKEIVSAIKLEPCDYHAVYDRILHMEIAALARIALAAKQAKPVAYADAQAFKNFQQGIASKEWMWAKEDAGLQPIYTTPQPAHTEQDGWIKCSERMPDNKDYVLAGDFESHYWPDIPNTQVGTYADWFDDGNPAWDDGDGHDLHLKKVTHWMPLPTAPKPESER